MPERAGGYETSLSDAVERVVESSQRALMARLELLRIEAEEDLGRTLRSAAVAFLGVLVLAVAWVGFTALAIHWLEQRISLGGSLAVMTLLNAAAGAALVVAGARTMGRLRLMRPDRGGES